jgi:hypothetical protein
VGLRTLPLPPGRCLSRLEVSLCETKGIGRERLHKFRRQRGEDVKDSSGHVVGSGFVAERL